MTVNDSQGSYFKKVWKFSAGPDAGGEGFDRAKANFFVELDGGFVVGGDCKRQFLEFHGTQRVDGGVHEHAAEAVALVAGEAANLCGVGPRRGGPAGPHRAREPRAPRLPRRAPGALAQL